MPELLVCLSGEFIMIVASLEHLSLQKIAKDIEIWCEDVTESDFNRYLYVLGPFDCFDSRLIQELINILARKKQLKVSYLHTLLHSNLKSLDLSVCSSLVSDTVLRLATNRCKKLKQLSLKGCTRLSTKALRYVPKNLPSLQNLNLSGCTTCTDELLCDLGKCCPDLLILKLESCTQVTDHGLEWLLGSSANQGCTKILEMNLSSTGITDKGTALLLRSLSNLRSLYVASTAAYQGSNFMISASGCGTQLNCLDVSYTSITDSAVKLISDTCPSITDLSLACCGSLTGASLRHIASLKHLRKLNIASMRIEFQADLIPFLRSSGNGLEVLDVTAMEGIDTQCFGLHCCSLRELKLIDCEDVVGSFTHGIRTHQSLSLAEACPNLELLNLQGCCFSPRKSFQDHLSALITNSTNVEVLDLSNIKDLDDQSIIHFASSSELSCFSSLNLSHCMHVTIEGIVTLLNRCKNLTLLDLSHCHSISLREVEGLRKKMAKVAGRKHLEVLWI